MQPRGKGGNAADRRALLSAGELVISEKGFAGTTEQEVAKRAKVGPQVFREHFADMSALLRALSSVFTDQMLTVTNQSTHSGIWRGAAARDVVEVAVRSILDVVIERKGLV